MVLIFDIHMQLKASTESASFKFKELTEKIDALGRAKSERTLEDAAPSKPPADSESNYVATTDDSIRRTLLEAENTLWVRRSPSRAYPFD